MQVVLTAGERGALERAARAERRVRRWRRLQALLLLGRGQRPEAVAAAVGARRASVYAWAAAWGRGGLAGLGERPRPGRQRELDAAAERLLEARLAAEPEAHGYQATGWTVPLLHRELREAGYAVSARTVRRTLHRLGWRWKRPKYVLGRPDPDYAAKRGR
jgi:transposase